ncbi:MAG: hypothetical protein Q9201_000170 [Fulgogasparrea decipioides]
MASVTSLGIHKPSALPYLIAEGILTSQPVKDSFRWQSVSGTGECPNVVEEELLTTDYCVVWSRDGVVQRVFRFETEKEKITQAVFARFHSRLTPFSKRVDLREKIEDNGSGASATGLEEAKRTNEPYQGHSIDRTFAEGPRYDNANTSKDRALVVILKTQAHIFFLEGTNHIVNLPFEVEAVFPLPQGILLQRKPRPGEQSWEASPRTKRLPVAPPNSFAFSQPSSGVPYGSQRYSNTPDFQAYDDDNLLVASLVRKELQRATNLRANNLPRLFSLTEPLSQLGTVGLRGAQSGKNSSQQLSSIFKGLDDNDDLLYLSPSDELAGASPAMRSSEPFILGVTLNRETDAVTIWQVTHASHNNSSTRKSRAGSLAKGTFSRRRSRRSSLGPGAATGTATPISRGANTRDSFGLAQPRARTAEDFPPSPQNDLASQLNTALDNPANPAKSSRRVSSLLARADLSTSQDNTTFSELVGGHRVSEYARRGPSFGADHTRSSLIGDSRLSMSKPRLRPSVRASIESQSLHGQEDYEDCIDINDIDDLSAFDALDIREGARGLRQEYSLTEIYTTLLTPKHGPHTAERGEREKLSVYTLQPPKPGLADNDEDQAVHLCFADRVARILISFRIQVRVLLNHRVTPSQPTSAAINGNTYTVYVPRVTNLARLDGVIDSCKLQDHDYTRVLVLSETADGKGCLSLQAPWSASYDIALPEKLNLYNPTKITTGVASRQKREGGYKRIISQGPQLFSALQHEDCQGQIDVVDSEERRHRMYVQLRPRNPVVRKVIQTCDAVMPLVGDRRETILCAWWTVVRWLRSRAEVEENIEWTALVVVLFSVPAGSIPDWQSESTSMQKRRKVGLLRSSSGANTDLESWEVMLSQEAGHLGSLPSWMQGPAWQWVTNQQTSAIPKRTLGRSPRTFRPLATSNVSSLPSPKKSAYILHCGALAREAIRTSSGSNDVANKQPLLPIITSQNAEWRGAVTASLLIALHLQREEMKLDSAAAEFVHSMTPVLAQLGGWLGWKSWNPRNSYYALENADMENWLFDESVMTGRGISANEPFGPPSVLHHVERLYSGSSPQPFISLLDLVDQVNGPSRYSRVSPALKERLRELTPRTIAITQPFTTSGGKKLDFSINHMISAKIDSCLLETLPESIAATFRSSMSELQAQPPLDWEDKLLSMIGRDDLRMLGQTDLTGTQLIKASASSTHNAVRDVHTTCSAAVEVESVGAYDGSAEADRQTLTRMIFKDDQRFAEATRLVHPLTAPTARCSPEPNWSDTELLEAQQELVKIVATRTLSVSLGRSLLSYCARFPLITEKFPIHGFTLSCVMKPSNTTITADRSAYTEEKVSWAFFHAGVEAGLSISKDAKGINTSWILFNKPHELKNRHAGFLLGLGLNGHLRNVTKFTTYNYLTPKHPMTSIGFLLGLAASYLGTMDSNVTRLLSLHVIRMLPCDSAELNVSPLTQTSGIMGIGLLYCNTQHRRMSEMMLSEIENMDYEENANPVENLRDEGYRLAAGFALGYINLGRGKDLRGLHDMQIVERLLVLAIGTKKADLVHILDKATAAATVAIALIFMKTGDVALARKIDIPDTIHQFDYVRPDILLLRTVARHLIMWDQIRPSAEWMQKQLPPAFQNRRQLDARSVSSQELPYLNVLAGLCLSLGLRYAGTGELDVRNLLCHQLDQFIWMCRLPSTTYDRRLTRITARNCQDTVALAAACVMAGTGDLNVFRRLRALHGRTDAETPYGSHLAAHLAIGVLFLGGGTYSFGTSNKAVASLLCAFYPLFPTSVLDNKSHLQAFRHFWVLATEARCLVVRDIDTHRPLPLPVTVNLRNGLPLPMTAPCLLPELNTIATIVTSDQAYWPVSVNLADNPSHLSAFQRHQIIHVRRRAAGDTTGSAFSATMLALNDAQAVTHLGKQVFSWIFTLPVFEEFDRTEQMNVLPPDLASVIHRAAGGTAIDDCLVLSTGCMDSGRSERLWNLRLLFAWADMVNARSGRWGWLRDEAVMGLRARVGLRLTSEREGES